VGLDLEATGSVERSHALVEGGGQRSRPNPIGGGPQELPPDPAIASSPPDGDRGDPNRIAVDELGYGGWPGIDSDRTNRSFFDRREKHEPSRGVQLSPQAVGISFQHRRVKQPHDSEVIVGGGTAERRCGHLLIPFELQQQAVDRRAITGCVADVGVHQPGVIAAAIDDHHKRHPADQIVQPAEEAKPDGLAKAVSGRAVGVGDNGKRKLVRIGPLGGALF
jgi:hypothetical protein